MSLRSLLLNQKEFFWYYNCSYDVNLIALEDRRKIVVGVLYITLGVFCQALYLPCLWALYQLFTREQKTSSCYKIMFYLGVVDCIGICVTGFCAGIASIRGDVFCQSPIFIYSFCTVGMYAWCTSNVSTTILSINRCMMVYDVDLANIFFKGKRTLLWLAIPTLGGLVFVWITPPVIFSSIDSSALFNPHRYYLPDDKAFHDQYHEPHIVLNWFIVITIAGIYSVFCVSFGRKMCFNRYNNNNKILAKEINTFLQVLITCILMFITSLGFIYQQYLSSMPVFVFSSLILYQGSPALIYLSMNQTVRSLILHHRVFGRKLSLGSAQPVSGKHNAGNLFVIASHSPVLK